MNKRYLVLIAAALLATAAFFNACAPGEEEGELTIDCSANGDDDCDYAEYCLETEVLDESGFPTGDVKYECTLRDTCDPEQQDCPLDWYCDTTGYCFKGDAPVPDNSQPDNDTTLPDTAQPDNGTDSVIPDTAQPDTDSATPPDTVQPDTDSAQPDNVVPDTDTGGTLNFTEDFEAGAGNWTLEGDWQVGVPGSGPTAAHGGTNCAATNLTGNYSDSADAKMILTQQLSVPGGAAEPVIEFYAYVNAEKNIDYAEVLIRKSTDTWESATKAVFTTGQFLDQTKTKLTGNVPATDTGWYLYSASLSAVKGESVQIAFRFRSDSSSAAAGIYIDDVHIH